MRLLYHILASVCRLSATFRGGGARSAVTGITCTPPTSRVAVVRESLRRGEFRALDDPRAKRLGVQMRGGADASRSARGRLGVVLDPREPVPKPYPYS